MLANTMLIVPESVAFAAISMLLLVLKVEGAVGIRANTAGATSSSNPTVTESASNFGVKLASSVENTALYWKY